MKEAIINKNGLPCCPYCKSTNWSIGTPEDRYDRNLPTKCNDCGEEYTIYDES